MTATTGSGRRRAARQRLEYLGVASAARFVRLVPRSWALAFGAGIGQLGWWLGLRRALVLSNLRQALPEASEAARRRIAARAARNFGRTSCEFLRFAGRDRERVSELVQLEGLELLRTVLAEGRGALLVSAHLGAWALYVTALAAAGIPAALLVGVQHNRRVDELILGIPGDSVRFISKGKGSPRQLLQALREGRVIVMVADHYSSDQQVLAPFLGREAYTLPLPGALVARYGLELFRMLGQRVGGGRHQLRIERVALPSVRTGLAREQRAGEEGAESAASEELRLCVARRMNESLGEAVRELPEQYFWYHDRWKRRVYEQRRQPRGAAGEAPAERAGEPAGLLQDEPPR